MVMCAMIVHNLVWMILAIRSLSLEALHWQTTRTSVLHRSTLTHIGHVGRLLLRLDHLHEMLLLLLAHW